MFRDNEELRIDTYHRFRTTGGAIIRFQHISRLIEESRGPIRGALAEKHIVANSKMAILGLRDVGGQMVGDKRQEHIAGNRRSKTPEVRTFASVKKKKREERRERSQHRANGD